MTQRVGEAVQPVRERTSAAVALWLQPAIERSAMALERSVMVSRAAAAIVAFVLRPLSLLALTFGAWRLGVDLGWTQDFVISSGLLSHWQVWMMLALAAHSTAVFLSRASESPAK